jgi:hypothetical protein
MPDSAIFADMPIAPINVSGRVHSMNGSECWEVFAAGPFVARYGCVAKATNYARLVLANVAARCS